MQDEATVWGKRGKALGYAIKETIEKTAADSAERQAAIEELRKAFDEGFRVVDEEGNEREADGMDLLAIDLVHGTYLVYEDRQVELCRHLVELLEKVKGQRYDFFLQGFYSDNPKLEHSQEHPPGYVLRTFLDQISVDLKIAQAAVFQRQHPKVFEKTEDGWKLRQKTNLVGTTQHAWSLFLADTLSEHALKPALDKGFFKQKYTPVVAYFERSLSARLVPYDNILLIGIPYSTFVEPVEANLLSADELKIGISPDLLAIPHEIGHYLFWNGKIPGSEGPTIQAELQKGLEQARIRPWDWRWRWLEEIFADVYGCLIAGPVIVLDFQDRLTDNLPEHFQRDLAKHPTPILRPFIQSGILRKIKAADGVTRFARVPELLDDRWREMIPARLYRVDGDPLEAMYQIQGVTQLIKGQEIVDAVEEMVDLILEALKALRPVTNSSWPWTSDLSADDKDVAMLYQEFFDKWFPVESSWLEYEVSSKPALQSFWDEKDKVIAMGMISESDWKRLFLVQGWSTEGPEDDKIR